MDVQQLLDAAKKAQGLTTDKGLADALGITKQAVSNWRKGVSLPDTVTCATLAGLTGIPLARVLGIVGEARAISREEKAVWRKLAASVGIFLIALSLSIDADAANFVTHHDSGPTLHYAKLYISHHAALPRHSGAIRMWHGTDPRQRSSSRQRRARRCDPRCRQAARPAPSP